MNLPPWRSRPVATRALLALSLALLGCDGRVERWLALEEPVGDDELPWRPGSADEPGGLEGLEPGTLVAALRPLRPWIHGVWPMATPGDWGMAAQLEDDSLAILHHRCQPSPEALREVLREEVRLGVAAVEGEGRCLLRLDLRRDHGRQADPEGAQALLRRLREHSRSAGAVRP